MEKKACGCGAKTKAKMNADLTKDAKAIVAGVEGYGKEDHTKKAAEVKAAFAEKKPAAKAATAAAKKPAAKTIVKAAAKPAAKKVAAKPAATKKPAAKK